MHHVDTAEHIDDTDGDESQSLLETGEQVTMPLDYQSLMPDQVNKLQKLLHEFPQLTSDKLGCTDVLGYDVIVGDAPPIRQQPYRVPLATQETMERERDKILKLGAIKLYSSSWASPVVQINKINGDMHFCVVFCELNPVAVFDAYPMPQVDILERMGPANTCPLWT